MSKTVTRLFPSLEAAKIAVAELERAGVPYAEISVITRAEDGHAPAGPDEHLGDHDPRLAEEPEHGGEGGAIVGTTVGLLAGLPLLAVPGFGPVMAVGWLVGTLATAVGGAAIGAATGGLVATLTHHGIEEDDAQVLSEAVRRGDTLVSARVQDSKYEAALEVMSALKAVDAPTRGEAYVAEGWSPPPPDGATMTAAAVTETRVGPPTI